MELPKDAPLTKYWLDADDLEYGIDGFLQLGFLLFHHFCFGHQPVGEAVFADMDNLGLCLAGYHKAAGIERISRMLGDDIGFTAD